MPTGAEAARILPLLDLTNLDPQGSAEDIAALCREAVTPAGPVAAVCLYPRFVAQARTLLNGTGVRIATVANFPAGTAAPADVASEIATALADGADEIDLVLPYAAYRAGDHAAARAVVVAARAACGPVARLKVILETGWLEDTETIAAASHDAIAAGADFLKTSTGTLQPGATLPAAGAMLAVIRDYGDETGRTIGFKAAGGIRTIEEAADYITLAERLIGADFIRPESFRFGASGLLRPLLAALETGS
jgi:deoxyribose-phosphate aldolase